MSEKPDVSTVDYREIARALFPSEPNWNAKDGPCCHEKKVFGEGQIESYVCIGCDCNNSDDAIYAGQWAEEANRYLWAVHYLKEKHGITPEDL